jgi:hypothetical protein
MATSAGIEGPAGTDLKKRKNKSKKKRKKKVSQAESI